MSADYLLKVIALGNGGVGKTAITQRFATGRFQEMHKVTIGVELSTKDVIVDGLHVQLQIWDTGGQEHFKRILPLYYMGAIGALVVYDITQRKTFENIDFWINEIQKHCEENIPIILVANKQDLVDQMEVPNSEGKQKAEELSSQLGRKVTFFETSAKLGENIDTLFQTLVKRILDEVVSNENEE